MVLLVVARALDAHTTRCVVNFDGAAVRQRFRCAFKARLLVETQKHALAQRSAQQMMHLSGVSRSISLAAPSGRNFFISPFNCSRIHSDEQPAAFETRSKQ